MTNSDKGNALSVILLAADDSVVVALSDIPTGEMPSGTAVRARDHIPSGHKMACTAICAGDPVIKYGQIIGHALRDIAAGEHVHVHNLSMADFDRDPDIGVSAKESVMIPKADRATFQGFIRADGRVGTRNYIGIVTSVNCSATVARQIARAVEDRGLLKDYPNVEGVVPIVHGAGCCIARDDEAFAMLQRTLWGHACHPNFAATLMLGLGCETNQIPYMVDTFGAPPQDRLYAMTIQQEGGTRRTIDRALEWLGDALPAANALHRETVPATHLTVALQCGGSDGYSGITANPALGLAVDRLVRNGGSAVLAETPEIYGAEHLLTRRAATTEVGEKLLERIRWWEDYAARHGSAMNNNPTPGNKAGGLTTILEKSLGAVAKAGSTNLVGVYRYAEPITVKGLSFMDSPGYDPVSITGQVASGCNLVAFTTGRGSVYGNKPAPCLKLATNSHTYAHMEDDMDIDCGTAASGETDLEMLGDAIFEHLLKVASGARTKSEVNGFGDAEFAPWQIGAQM